MVCRRHQTLGAVLWLSNNTLRVTCEDARAWYTRMYPQEERLLMNTHTQQHLPPNTSLKPRPREAKNKTHA
jgi:hypothetical protein